MRLLAVPLACACLLAAAPAWSSDAASLDLSLPQASMYRADPPGAYYGDTSGVPASRGEATLPRLSRCPTAPDGQAQAVTGSVSTGIGYSSGAGNSHWNAASLNYCKDYATDGGNARTINVQLDVGQYDGPLYGPQYGPGFGPGFGPGMRGPDPGFFGPGPASRGDRR